MSKHEFNSLQVLAAVVLDGGAVQEVLLQNWPGELPEPVFLVLDYDTQGYEGAHRVCIGVSAKVSDFGCFRLTVTHVRAGQDALLPSKVLEALQTAEGINRYTLAEHGEFLMKAVQALYAMLDEAPDATERCSHQVRDVRLALRNLRACVGDAVALDTLD